MDTEYARQQLKELLNASRPGRELAMEIAGLLASCFKKEVDVTIRLHQEEEVLFYSTLPEDEAGFFVSVGRADEAAGRPGPAFGRAFPLLGSGYEGYVVLEGSREQQVTVGEDGQRFMQACSFAIAYCLLAERSVENYRLDPLTGIPGRPAFQEALKEFMDSGNKGYLLAARPDVRHNRTGYWNDEDEERFCWLARKSQSVFARSYRISDTMVAMLTDETDRERVFEGLQELSEGAGTVGAVYLPLASLQAEHVFERLEECMMQCENGTIHGPERMPLPLPFWNADRKRTGR